MKLAIHNPLHRVFNKPFLYYLNLKGISVDNLFFVCNMCYQPSVDAIEFLPSNGCVLHYHCMAVCFALQLHIVERMITESAALSAACKFVRLSEVCLSITSFVLLQSNPVDSPLSPELLYQM